MVKIAALAGALLSAIAVPFVHRGDSVRPGPASVEQELLRRMNAGPDGRITRNVLCRPATADGRTLACVLKSTRSTVLGVRVVVHGSDLRTAWEPLAG